MWAWNRGGMPESSAGTQAPRRRRALGVAVWVLMWLLLTVVIATANWVLVARADGWWTAVPFAAAIAFGSLLGGTVGRMWLRRRGSGPSTQ